MSAAPAPLRVGIVGCGDISETYLRARYPAFEYVACADLDPSRSRATAHRHHLRAMSPEALYHDDKVDIVCNLTVPQAHTQVTRAGLESGKHVYQEKPLALQRSEATELLVLGQARSLLYGCAPDTFLGAGLQTCRRLIDSGAIGTPVAAMAQMANHGHEHWHPNPAFYYERGGGPLFDMGPYYLTALVSLLGPVSRVSAMARGAGTERVLGPGPRAGQRLAVEVATHVAGTLEFASGVVGSLVMSFDTWSSPPALLEVHGTQASLSLPDPNTFGGPVRLFAAGGEGWREVPVDGFERHQRGVGLADLASVAAAGGVPRADASLAYHVLDVMEALGESGVEGRFIEVQSTAERPLPMPAREHQVG